MVWSVFHGIRRKPSCAHFGCATTHENLQGAFGIPEFMPPIRRRGFQSNHSGSLAKKRLKLILVTDRVDCPPELIERMKDDLIHVISKYMTVGRDGIEVRIVNSSPGTALYAVFPILELPNKGIC